MKRVKELSELRRQEAPALLSALEKEKADLAKEKIAVKLGKLSKVHNLKSRRTRIARLLTVLSEKLT